MIANVVVDNLAYLVGAVVLAVIIGLLMALRHRRPRSLEANMESFNRGLKALSPDASPKKRRMGKHQPAPVTLATGAPRGRTAVPLGRDVPVRPVGPAPAHNDTEA